MCCLMLFNKVTCLWDCGFNIRQNFAENAFRKVDKLCPFQTKVKIQDECKVIYPKCTTKNFQEVKQQYMTFNHSRANLCIACRSKQAMWGRFFVLRLKITTLTCCSSSVPNAGPSLIPMVAGIIIIICNSKRESILKGRRDGDSHAPTCRIEGACYQTVINLVCIPSEVMLMELYTLTYHIISDSIEKTFLRSSTIKCEVA